MKLLIDADYIVYKCCAAAETEVDWGDDVIVVTSKFSEALAAVKRDLTKIQQSFLWDKTEFILFFSDSKNFRKEIYEEYKGHRNRKKPCGYKRVIKELANQYEVIKMPTLEADDAMGIYATQHPGNVIVSPDKDMKQIPGSLYNLTETLQIDPQQGLEWHYLQTLAGDQTDGYSGVPGVGLKRAADLFEKNGYTWQTIVDAFAEKNLGEDVALMNARLAKILTKDEYDFTTQRPILWNPATASS
jgi:DNA polymerase-1